MKFGDPQITAILRGRKAMRRIHFPLLGCDVGVRILTEAQADHAKLGAADYCRAKKVDLDIDPEFYDRAIKQQILWRSLFDPDSDADKPEPFFPSEDNLREVDSGVLDALFAVYQELLEEVLPQRRLDEKGVDALIEALKKEPEQMEALRLFEHETLRLCVRSLVSRLPAT